MASKPLSPVVPVLRCPHYRPPVLIPQTHAWVCDRTFPSWGCPALPLHHRCSPDRLWCSSVWPLCSPRCLSVPSWRDFPDRWTPLLPAGPLLRRSVDKQSRQSSVGADLISCFGFLVRGEANEKMLKSSWRRSGCTGRPAGESGALTLNWKPVIPNHSHFKTENQKNPTTPGSDVNDMTSEQDCLIPLTCLHTLSSFRL